MYMTVELLSRIQFGVTTSFHFLFPPMTIGISVILVILQTLRVATGKAIYLDLSKFWTRVFGLIFAIGVATGIPLEFQFGTNWAQYARFVGDIFGSPLAIEGIYAFFLESGFLALLLFGWNKVGPRTHLFATCMVALGAHFSAIWIIVANSWMHTPAGYHLARQMKVAADGQLFPMTTDLGTAAFTVTEVALPADYVVQPTDLHHVRAVIDDFYLAILNPSTLDRLTHTVLACWITGAFVVVGVSAWWLLRGKHLEAARASIRIGIAVATVACLLQLVAADSTARGVAIHQPTKLAAIEGLSTTRTQAGLGVVGFVRWKYGDDGQIVGIEDHALRIPGMLSVLVSGKFLHLREAAQTEVKGLADLPSTEFLRTRHPGATDEELAQLRPSYWPNAPLVFQTYHLMIALGVTLTMLAVIGCTLLVRGRLDRTHSRFIRAFLAILVVSPVLAHFATQAGWFTAEFGRQPWIVYEVLKTVDAASTVVKPGQVMFSLALFFIIYLLLTYLFTTLFARMVSQGPIAGGGGHGVVEGWKPLSLRSDRQTKG